MIGLQLWKKKVAFKLEFVTELFWNSLFQHHF